MTALGWLTAFRITYGAWESEGLSFGELTDGKATSTYAAELTIHFPVSEATKTDDTKPERIATVFIDASGLDQVGMINVEAEGHDNGDGHTYAYGGTISA